MIKIDNILLIAIIIIFFVVLFFVVKILFKLISFFIRKIHTKLRYKREKIVKENSELYKALLKLNESYIFKDLKDSIIFIINCNSKAKFTKYDDNKELLDEQLIEYIILNEKSIKTNILDAIKNKEIFDEYCLEYDNLNFNTNKSVIEELDIKYNKFIEIENRLKIKNKLDPVVEISACVGYNYTSPKGRNSYNGKKDYSFNDLKYYLKEANKLEEYRKSYEAHKKRERSKVNDGLRYDILERDNFRCQICGATQKEGAKLVVDHIIPVAKGGMTTKDNLQTLCQICNSGKSDKCNDDDLKNYLKKTKSKKNNW